jgi:crossover junction endodeoxyribonuclease RuvC
MPPKVKSFLELQTAVKSKDSPFMRTTSRIRRSERLSTLPVADVILGVDPGLQRTGFGIIAHGAYIDAGVLSARANDPLPQRLQTLCSGLSEVLEAHRPDIVVVEELFSNYQHPRSALLMAHARGVLLLAARQGNVPVHSFLPNEVKQVVAGAGHATKAAMQRAVQARLKLKELPEPHDAADALALALCFALRQQTRIQRP